MKIQSLLVLGLWFIVLLVTGCASLTEMSSESQFEVSQRDFTQRLRWQDFPGAANYFTAEQRASFLDNFQDQKKIHFTDLRPVGLDFGPDGLTAKQTLDLEYYALPSLTVKTFRFSVDWSYDKDGNRGMGAWQIINPFPEFPPQ